MVDDICLDTLDRPQALALLIEHCFTMHGAGLLYTLQRCLGGPELAQLLDEARSSVAAVLDWAGDGDGLALARAAFPDSTGTDRTQRELVQRWVREGKQVPDLASIDLFCKALAEHGNAGQKARVPDLRRWLVVARALSWLERQTAWPVRKALMQQVLLSLGTVDVGAILNDAVKEADRRFAVLNESVRQLYGKLLLAVAKEPGDRDRLQAELVALDELTRQHDGAGRTRFRAEWLWGRWLVMAGQHEAALSRYKRALGMSEYRAGPMHKQIAKEALVLAAWVGGDKPLLNRLKHRAIAWGWLAQPRDRAVVVEDWEIEQLRDQFPAVFPSDAWFPEAQPDTDETVFPLPWLAIDFNELERRKPDLRHPDRVITVHSLDGKKRRWSQLHMFAMLGKTEPLRRLLEHGASVDQLGADGGSALLVALQRAHDTGDRGALDLLLAQPHAKSTLDAATARKRLTPLLCAMELGAPDVVERLLEMTANPDLRGQVDNMTPLYLCMGRLAIALAPEKLHRPLRAAMLAPRGLVENDALRRYAGVVAGVFGDSSMRHLLSTPRNRQLFESCLEAFASITVSRYSRPKLLRIVELLLLAGADPNASHDHRAPGRTPLMLAAENDDLEAFELMLRHRGDPQQRDGDGMDALRVALGFGSRRIVERLRGL